MSDTPVHANSAINAYAAALAQAVLLSKYSVCRDTLFFKYCYNQRKRVPAQGVLLVVRAVVLTPECFDSHAL
jgi:hypothetical protein